MGIYADQSIARPDRKSAGAADRQARRAAPRGIVKYGYRPSRWLLKSLLPILTILVCCAFVAACLGLVVGLLAGNAALVGFVFWVLPRIGFLALVVLLVRFVAATEPQLK